MAESFDGQLHDKVLVDVAVSMSDDTKEVDWPAIPPVRQQELILQAKEMCLSCAFIVQSDPRRFGRLKEELENDYTKGNDTYPQDMVKAYQLLNEYKNWSPKNKIPEVSGLAFSQDADHPDNAWWADVSCHNCKKKGHIRPNCPHPRVNRNEDEDEAIKTSQNNKPTKNKKKSI
jgi:hypothetical protein